MILLCSLTACASSSNQRTAGPDATPEEVALISALNVRDEAVVEAFEQSEAQRGYRVLARYNPGRCGAPDTEVFVYGRWERAALTGKNERLDVELQEWTDTAPSEPLLRARISGRWDRLVWTSPSGVTWPVFKVTQLEGLVASRDAQRSSGLRGMSDGEWLATRCTGAGSRSTP